jgi:hypothetical protein
MVNALNNNLKRKTPGAQCMPVVPVCYKTAYSFKCTVQAEIYFSIKRGMFKWQLKVLSSEMDPAEIRLIDLY